MMTPETMHKALVAVAESFGLPHAFKRDLYEHDYVCLCEMVRMGRTKFWWKVYDCGTHFSSNRESYVRMGKDEQEHTYQGDLVTGQLVKL